jgi:hypothetical protein
VEGAQVRRGGRLAVALAAGAGCAGPAPAGSPAAPGNAAAATASAAPSKACAAPGYRQFDFWIGDWDLVVHARNSPASDRWADARGHQRVEATLGGCAIAEHFTADGPWATAAPMIAIDYRRAAR